jgi:hypothetical protein
VTLVDAGLCRTVVACHSKGKFSHSAERILPTEINAANHRLLSPVKHMQPVPWIGGESCLPDLVNIDNDMVYAPLRRRRNENELVLAVRKVGGG